MHPILFEIGPLKIHSYGFMLAIAFLVGLFVAQREARRVGEDPETVSSVAMWILVAAVLGARLFHVVVFWDELVPPRLWSALKIWEGGLVYYGGFLGAVAGTLLFIARTGGKHSIFQLGDIIAPSVALGLMFGRIGCTLVGCCYGKPCPVDFPLGITFPPQTIGVSGIPLYPTQPAEALGSLTIFLFLWLWLRHRRRFQGQVLFSFLILYSLLRFMLEYWRDDPRGFLDITSFAVSSGVPPVGAAGIWLSESQLVSVFFVLAIIPLWIWKARRDKRLGVPVGPVPAAAPAKSPGGQKKKGKKRK
ncbi:MAG: prolipoprotein diacylglyceryl transferase [Candidatus Lernaella stagnicola]|nr:prolipoprotein diacylglyceryl transferase [Candidatus Lernaella stagnicola]